MSELEELFTKIRVDFLFSHPFLSVLALSLKHIWGENGNYPVLTDGRAIYLDGNKLSEYSPDEIKYLYAHVLLHVALKHPFRQKTKDPALWNGACDIATNLILSKFSNIKCPNSCNITSSDKLNTSCAAFISTASMYYFSFIKVVYLFFCFTIE